MITETAEAPIGELGNIVASWIKQGKRLGVVTARAFPNDGHIELITVLLDPQAALAKILISQLGPNERAYPSISALAPQAHWFERALLDLFGVTPTGHPRLKSVILHEAWPEGFYPLAQSEPHIEIDGSPGKTYDFLEVKGEGVYEIPVGPIHAGIIEPGHFRFSCLGEVIQNLEIRLGYTHRGVEQRIAATPWKAAHLVAEAASSDSAVANAIAHAQAIEQILGVAAPPAALGLRALALEIERVASHIGDLGGICGDIGFAGPSSIFAQLRGSALGLGERLTGARQQTAYVVPGGVTHPLAIDGRREILDRANALSKEFDAAQELLIDSTAAIERMEDVGIVRPSLARDFGLVGPAARACGIDYDVRRAFPTEPYTRLSWDVASASDCDVHARALVRIQETRASFDLIRQILEEPADWENVLTLLSNELPANAIGIGIVEAWRGELIHLICTDEAGKLARYCIKDPSVNNWTGLAIAVRGQLVADFPLCNKSFGLSYSGNDL